jgi:hypothetical protein
MRRQGARYLPWIAAIAMAMGRPVCAQSGAISTSPGLFEYHSAFWVNLHHLLYEQARALEGLDSGRAIVRRALADTSGIERLTPGERGAWDAALRYYRVHLARHDVLDRDMAAIKAALGNSENDATLRGASDARGAIDDSLRRVLEGAAPAYRAVWWPRHDRGNRAWIAAMRPAVDAHGPAMARELARIFHIEWSDFLIRVDASAYSNWAGAYTTNYPDRITVATADSDYDGPSGLEMLFHESLHTLDDSVRSALVAATARQGKRLPSDFVHAMIFFTAGEVARRELANEVPNYQPTAARLGIWERGGFPRHLPILQRYWLPWIERRSTFGTAIDSIAAALR